MPAEKQNGTKLRLPLRFAPILKDKIKTGVKTVYDARVIDKGRRMG